MLLFLTAVALFVLGKRLGSLNVGSVPDDCQEYIDHLQKFLLSTQDLLFNLPYYKIYPTKSWKLLMEAQNGLHRIGMGLIEEKLKEIKGQDQQLTSDDDEPSENEDFVTYMILKGKMTPEEVAINAADLLGAGVDTVSPSHKRFFFQTDLRNFK